VRVGVISNACCGPSTVTDTDLLFLFAVLHPGKRVGKRLSQHIVYDLNIRQVKKTAPRPAQSQGPPVPGAGQAITADADISHFIGESFLMVKLIFTVPADSRVVGLRSNHNRSGQRRRAHRQHHHKMHMLKSLFS
jgi:hypothetical protein